MKTLQTNFLATCGRDKRIWIWSIDDDDDYECASVLSSHTQDVKSVSWHPHKDTLMSTSYDDSIKIYEEQEDDWECINTLGMSLAVDVHDAQNHLFGPVLILFSLSFDKTLGHFEQSFEDLLVIG